jgi:hypothetical protein
MDVIKCKVVADKVWHSAKNRFLYAGDEVEFPAEVKDFTGKTVPFKVGPSFEQVVDEVKPSKGKGKTEKSEDLV